MTVFDVEELHRYWQKHPPLHLMLAAFLGVSADEPVAAVPSSPRAQAIPSNVVLAGIPGMMPGTDDDFVPIFDVAELMRQRPN
jgi:hypothetical protein